MNSYLSITLRTFTIWILASVINGIFCGTYLGITGQEHEPVFSLIFISGFFSLIFSVPGFFIFWIIMLVLLHRQLYGRSLFRAGLSTGIILSIGTAFFSFKLFDHSQGFAISFFIVVSAIASIMMHFNLFKK